MRVVLVPDETTLAQLRMAIGEEHVVAATDQAFAFADGWILAARKGSVFELMGELGWRMRPIELATRAELIGERHTLSPFGDDGGDTPAARSTARLRSSRPRHRVIAGAPPSRGAWASSGGGGSAGGADRASVRAWSPQRASVGPGCAESRFQPTPRRRGANSSGCSISHRIARESTSRGPGRLK